MTSRTSARNKIVPQVLPSKGADSIAFARPTPLSGSHFTSTFTATLAGNCAAKSFLDLFEKIVDLPRVGHRNEVARATDCG